MDEDQRKIAIGIGVLIFVIVLFFMIFSGGYGNKDELNLTPKKVKKAKTNSKKTKQNKEYANHSPSYSHHSSSHSRSPFSSAEKAKMKRERKEALKILKKVKQDWLLAKVNDEKMSARTREKYRFRLIKPYVKGMEALKNKNYPKALKELLKSLKDPMASPVTKYMSYMYMRTAALKMGDFELFVKIAEEQAELIEKEDLSVLGIQKTGKQKVWLEQFKELIEAGNDKNKQTELVDRLMRDGQVPADKRSQVEKDVQAEIDSYKAHFKEFFKHAS